ncbi:MAG TPA: hypothetical protein PLR17_03055 [Acetomicrobium flavidum]|nr:hypothetical protein [Acetomicrobium flavidum]
MSIILRGLLWEVMPMETGQVSAISQEMLNDVQGVVATTMLKKNLELQQVMLQELFQSMGISRNVDLLA